MFRFIYGVRNCRNLRKDEYYLEPDTLEEAVDSYLPDADLFLQVDEKRIAIDLGRDMFGLHEDLLSLAESIAFNHSSEGPYLDEIESTGPYDNMYSTLLTEAYEPKYIFFRVKDNSVVILTRTRTKGSLVIEEDDVMRSSVCQIMEVVKEISRFLGVYINDLANQFPIVTSLPDYESYMKRLELIEKELKG